MQIEVIEQADCPKLRPAIDAAIDECLPLFHPLVRADGCVEELRYDRGRVDIEAVEALLAYHRRMQVWHEARGVDGPPVRWHASYSDVLELLLERLRLEVS